MAPRPAALTRAAAGGLAAIVAAFSLAGCLRSGRPASARGSGCTECHAAHRAAEGSCADCHRGQPSADRRDLAHERLLRGRVAQFRLAEGEAPREGERLVGVLACRRCHVIAGSGNRLATGLDHVVWQREQQALVSSITAPADGMPAFGLDEAQAESIAAFLLRSADPRAGEEVYRVRFERRRTADGEATTVFERQCGPCHGALAPAGLLGTGTAGPNLSGLLTPFYPRTAPHDQPWTARAVTDWVRNPRAVRAGTTMPPVALTETERRQLEAELEAAR